LQLLTTALVFAGSFMLRLLDVDFTNDHFNPLSKARQVLHGELPFRDFVDPGLFLQILVSAGAQFVFGYSLLGEALLTISFLSAGAALTFLLASRASRSILIGLIVAALVIATYPRLYNYPKVFLYVFAIFLYWRYVDAPRLRNLTILGLFTAAAFLFRHDHGVFIGIGGVAAVAATHWEQAHGLAFRRVAVYAASAALPLLPFFIFLQVNGGILEYAESALRYTAGQRHQQHIDWPTFAVDQSQPLVELLAVPPAGPINVHWSKSVDPEDRAKLEARYGLTNGAPLDGSPRARSWQYDLLDPSETNIAALVNDPRVEDTDRVDHAKYRVNEPLLVSWKRVNPVLRLSIAPGILQRENAIPWLYYLFVSLPPIALLVVFLGRFVPGPGPSLMTHEGQKIVSAAILCAVACPLLLRSPLSTRLPDLAAPTAVLGAWLIGRLIADRRSARGEGSPRGLAAPALLSRAFRSAGSVAWSSVRIGTALSILGITTAAVFPLAEEASDLDPREFVLNPTEVLERAKDEVSELATSPPLDAWAPPGTDRSEGLARYVRECTKPTDKALVVPILREFYFYADRPFAGGNFIFMAPRFASTEEQSQFLERIEDDSVPIVVVDLERYKQFESDYALIDQYLDRTYQTARDLHLPDADVRVLVDRRLTPSGTFHPWSLPCFN
jgi:hypothetical protein